MPGSTGGLQLVTGGVADRGLSRSPLRVGFLLKISSRSKHHKGSKSPVNLRHYQNPQWPLFPGLFCFMSQPPREQSSKQALAARANKPPGVVCASFQVPRAQAVSIINLWHKIHWQPVTVSQMHITDSASCCPQHVFVPCFQPQLAFTIHLSTMVTDLSIAVNAPASSDGSST